MTEIVSTEGNNRKTHWELVCLWTACGFLVDMMGASGQRRTRKVGDGKRE